jgi:hypothetical protein
MIGYSRGGGRGAESQDDRVFGYGGPRNESQRVPSRRRTEFYLLLVNYNHRLWMIMVKPFKTDLYRIKKTCLSICHEEGKNGGRVVQYSPFRERPSNFHPESGRIPADPAGCGTYE